MKVCRECGQQVWLTKNVWQIRTVYPGSTQDYLCRECHDRSVAALVERTRRELGLPATQADQES